MCVSAAVIPPFAAADDDPHAFDDAAWLNVYAPQSIDVYMGDTPAAQAETIEDQPSQGSVTMAPPALTVELDVRN